MDQFLPFISQNILLSCIFIGLAVMVMTYEMKRGGQSISPHMLVHLMNKEDAVVIDIRDSKDFGGAHITGSKSIPMAKLEVRSSELDRFKDRIIIVVCAMGQHSTSAVKLLTGKGFVDVRRLAGGIGSWKGENLPLVKE